MKKLLGFLAVMLFAVPAVAQDWGNVAVTRMEGDVLSGTATNDAYDFGFMSDGVQICSRVGSALTYVRPGTSITASTGAAAESIWTVFASSSTIFIEGDGVATAGKAMPIPAASSTATSSDAKKACYFYPLRARGLVAHWVTSASATLDVQVFQFSKRD